jgi:hypothetical protein
VAFVHSCFSLGFCDVSENQQENNCGQTSHRKPTDKQLWTHVTETNRQTTVDKCHTENQQTNNCEQTSQKPREKQLWTNATQKTNKQTTVDKRCLLVYCMTFVHSCLSIGFLCGVCPRLFVCWFSVWRLSTVVCLLVFCVASNATQTTNRQTTVDKRHTENQQTNNCGQTPHRKPIDKQPWTKVITKTIFCVAFAHSCLSVDLLYDLCPQLFVYWFSV